MRHGERTISEIGVRKVAFACLVMGTLGGTTCISRTSYAQAPKLAAGVMKAIPSEPKESETVIGPRQFAALVESLPQWQPNFVPESDTLRVMAESTTFRHSVWQLEFEFKPVRMLTATDGRLVWYLVYKVRNVGGHIVPTNAAVDDESGDAIQELKKADFPVRFYPVFTLEGHDYKQKYPDQVLAGVIEQIHAKEIRDPSVRLHSTVEIGSQPLAVSGNEIDRSLWGVAMWENVDSRTDFFSIYVRGLSNAYQWPEGTEDLSKLTYKTLKLNFWRPGDTVREADDSIRYGLPKVADLTRQSQLLDKYGLKEPADYLWVYQ